MLGAAVYLPPVVPVIWRLLSFEDFQKDAKYHPLHITCHLNAAAVLPLPRRGPWLPAGAAAK